jgi:hypothetical protein
LIPTDVEMESDEESQEGEETKTSTKHLPKIFQTSPKRKAPSDDEQENEKLSKKLKRFKFGTKRTSKKSLDLKELNEDTSSGLKTSLHGTIYQVKFREFCILFAIYLLYV